MQRKTVDMMISLNDDLNVVYSRWDNGTFYRRSMPLWGRLRLLPYAPPLTNPTVVALAAKGVEWVLAEHVSITVQGTVYYTYETAAGTVWDTGTAGCHNVENGGGYLPVHAFSRRCEDDHISCCVMPKQGITPAAKYSFEIAVAPDPGAVFSHPVEGLADTFIIGRASE